MTETAEKKKLKFIFVHGLSGWGSYDEQYKRMPYWGMRGGDLIAHLAGIGFDCFAASVSPTGSAWDRACELYAQLAGSRVDYGEAHSKKYRHDRYGKDFSACPLIPQWDDKTRLVLIGHSFGGATVRLFSELLASGDPEEKAVPGGNPSPLFEGGMAGRIHTLVTLASPMNGTTAYDLNEDPSFDPRKIKVSLFSTLMARMMSRGTRARPDTRDSRDCAAFDMHLDRAMELNRRMPVLEHIYYFSVPCGFTEKRPDGTHAPKRGMEPLFVMRSCQMGAYTGQTAGGFKVDPEWRQNDGLVNTVSASSPTDAPSVPLDREHVLPGIWNVFPVYDGDHMALQGGLMRSHDIRGFYEMLLKMIRDL